MKYGSVCSGVEAASVAWEPLGFTPAWFSEIEEFPSAVLKHRFPNVPNLGDMTKIYEKEEFKSNDLDLLVGGTPCFVGSTLIVTQRGLIPISEVVVGDMVFTHTNRFCKVLAIGNKAAKTILVRGQGQSSGILTTAEHPFYARKKFRRWVGRDNGSYSSRLDSIQWVEAAKLKGLMWASPVNWPESEAPPILTLGRERSAPAMSEALAWVIGRWIGDGWCRINNRRGYVMICCGKHEADGLAIKVTEAGLIFSRSEERTTTRFQITNRAFAKWLKENFGYGAATKTIPTWVFGWNYRRSMLDGYLSADGCTTPNGTRLSTVSSRLALGAVLLGHSLGKSVSRRLVTHSRSSCVIDGRTVNELPYWQVTFYDNPRSSVELDGHRWGLVRSVEPHGEATVFNLEVEGDNSYVADGIVVHNCQSFSVAGLRKGLADPRGNLTLEFLRIADAKRPRWIVWENVPGVLSDKTNAFGNFIAGLSELGYGVCWRVLDAQFFGVPQRRRRVFVVGHLGDWRPPFAVLFERGGVLGHSPKSREERKEATRSAGARIDSTEQGISGAVTKKWSKGSGGPAGDECYNLVTYDTTQLTSSVNSQNGKPGDPCHTLAKNGDAPLLVGLATLGHTESNGLGVGFSETANTLEKTGSANQAVILKKARRLTPVECERLQGFPDNWTLIPWKSGFSPDSLRYQAMGNSMAVPVMRWLGRRIKMVDELM